MPEIKIPLKQLINKFAESVNNGELGTAVRSLAARLMVLTAHTIRIDSKVDAAIEHIQKRDKAIDEQISVLAGALETLATGGVAAARPSSPSPASEPAQTPSAAPVPAPAQPTVVPEVAEDTEEANEDLAQRILDETAAEVAAIEADAPTITPIKKVGGAK